MDARKRGRPEAGSHNSNGGGFKRSKRASLSGGKMEELETCSDNDDNGFISRRINQIKSWLLSHSQYLNFFTILILVSVPNLLFDLAGIMCGQLEKPFWGVFLATLIGKALDCSSN